MGEIIDMTGQRIGRLTVLRKSRKKDNHKKRTWWVCQCDCGRKIDVDGRFLRNGWVTSCGCVDLDKLKVGDKVFIENKKFPLTVRARSKRYIIITRDQNRYPDPVYYILDLEKKLRGKITPIFGGFTTDSDCLKRLHELDTGISEVAPWRVHKLDIKAR